MFFTQMYQMMSQSVDITLVIRKKEGQLIVSAMPKSNGLKDEAQNHIVPMTLTGTPQELDMGFMQGICQPMQKAAGLLTNMKLFEEQADKAAANSKAAKEQKDKAAKEAKEKKDKFDKLMKKAAELETEQKWSDAIATLKQAKGFAAANAVKGVDEKIGALRMKMGQGSLFAMEEAPQPPVPQQAQQEPQPVQQVQSQVQKPQQIQQPQQAPQVQVVTPAVQPQPPTIQQPIQQPMNGNVNGQQPFSQPVQQPVPQNMNANGQYMEYSSAINGQQTYNPQPAPEYIPEPEPELALTADYSAHREGEYDQYPDFPGYSANNMYNPQNL